MIEQRHIMVGLMFIFITLTFRDLMYGGRSSAQEPEETAEEASPRTVTPQTLPLGKKTPHNNFNPGGTSPIVKFLYCYSCGYRKAYEEYSTILNEKYPGIIVVGDNYPPPPMKSFLVQFIGLLKMAIIFMIIANVNPFTLMGRETPAAWLWLSSSKIYGCLITFFISNTIEGQLISSGAFEIFYDDVPIWSKIDTGRVPSPAELFQLIDNQMLSRSHLESFQY